MKSRIGRASIELTATGCIDCGTGHSWNWHEAKAVEVTVNGKAHHVIVHRCGDCELAQAKETLFAEGATAP